MQISPRITDWTESGCYTVKNIIRLHGRADKTAGVKASRVRTWPAAVFATDIEGQFVFVNANWIALSGLPQSAAMGLGWVCSIHDDDCQEVVRLWQEAVEGEQPFACSYRLKGAPVEAQWVLSQAVPQYDDDGELAGYSGTLIGLAQLSYTQTGTEADA